MARKYNPRRRKQPYKKRTYKKRPASSVKTATIKRMVRSEIARNIENKTKQQYVYTKNLYSTANPLFSDNVIPLGPDAATMSIPQGTGQGTRISNRIKTKKLMFKGTITPLPYDATSNPNPRPLQLKMVIFYDKSNPTFLPSVFSDFFQNGSSSIGFQNDLVDMWAPYNTDQYRILTVRNFKLGYSQYAGTAGTPATQGAYQAWSNNDFKMNANFKVNLTKFYPKYVKFNDNSNDPTTRGLYCIFYMSLADGQAAGGSWIPANVQFMQDYVFEDA